MEDLKLGEAALVLFRFITSLYSYPDIETVSGKERKQCVCYYQASAVVFLHIYINYHCIQSCVARYKRFDCFKH